MAILYYDTHIDFLGNNLYNVVLHPSGATPTPFATGQLWFDLVENRYRFWNGTTWALVGSGLGLSSSTWATIVGGENTSQQFVLSGTAVLGPSGGGVVNANRFNQSGIIQLLYGGLGRSLIASGEVLFGVSGTSQIGIDGNAFRFVQPTGMLGVGPGNWLTDPPNAFLTLSSGVSTRAALRLIPGSRLSVVADPADVGSIEFDGTEFSYIVSGGFRRIITPSGGSINNFVGPLSIAKGGTNRTSYPLGSLLYASGLELAPFIGNGIPYLCSGLFPTLLLPTTSGQIIRSNGTGWVVVNPTGTDLSDAIIKYPSGTQNTIVSLSGNYLPLSILRHANQTQSLFIIGASGLGGVGTERFFEVTFAGDIYIGNKTITFGKSNSSLGVGAVMPVITAETGTTADGRGIYFGTSSVGKGGLLDIRSYASGNGGIILARGGTGSGIAAGTIDISASGSSPGGSLFLQAINASGGTIDLRGMNSVIGGHIHMFSLGAGQAGYLEAIGHAGGNAGVIITSASATSGGGNIYTYGNSSVGGHIYTFGGTAASGIGGSLQIYGTDARGSQILGYGGSSTHSRAGDIKLFGGAGLTARGGDIQTYGATSSGGDISTYDGGGSINTRASGLLQLGEVGTRTSVLGAATADRVQYLANANGQIPVKYSTTLTAGATGYDVIHNLNTRDIVVNLYDATTFDIVAASINMVATTGIRIGLAVAYANNLRCVVIG